MNHLLTYIIADDDQFCRELTLQYLYLIPDIKCLAACNSAFTVNNKLQKLSPDFLILDIEMPGLSGLELAKTLHKLPPVIFITSHTHYAVDAFEINAIDYLIKPVLPDRLVKAVEKVRAVILKNELLKIQAGFKISDDHAFFIKDKSSFVKINYNEVLYIESLGDFVNIFLQNGDKKIALVSLKNLEQQLPPAKFIRISRTHMVNIEKITAIETTQLKLNKIQLQIGKIYTDTVLQAVIGNTAVKRFL